MHYAKTKFLLFILLVIPFIGSAQEVEMNTFISSLMQRMTLEEKIGQLNLVIPGYPASGDSAVDHRVYQKICNGEVGSILNLTGAEKIQQVQQLAIEKSRLKIPLLFGLDVIHGHKTTFPIPLAASCSWDLRLIEQSARLAAEEASADGINWTFSPMVDIARDPRWGRIAESSGEDTYLGSRIARAMVKGYQNDNLSRPGSLLACVKHFALYGAAESGLDYNTVDMSPLRMFNEYMPPYKAAIDAGAGSVMTSFNTINYIPATANKWLLTDVLRQQWAFKGFVVSDYRSINEMIAHGMGDLATVAAEALKAGCDMDMMGHAFTTTLKTSLQQGKISIRQIEDACRRILEAKYKLGLFKDPYRFLATPNSSPGRSVAKDLARRSFVLLKNEHQTLPLQLRGKIALIGPLANDSANVLGMWSSPVCTDAVTVLSGMQKWLGNKQTIQYAKGANISDDTVLVKNVNAIGERMTIDKSSPEELLKNAVDVATASDIIVAVVGEASEMTGESSSRGNLCLPESQRALLKALKKTGKPLVIVVMSGRPLILDWEAANADAILYAWHGGIETGNAIAEVLFGNYNPSGKLTTTFPRGVGQIPVYYNHLNTGKPNRSEIFQKWTTNYIDIPTSPLYPFGYGLSYTSFHYGDIQLSDTIMEKQKTIIASIDVTNTGLYDGEEVVQLYLRDVVASIARPVKELKGFEKVFLKKGETKKLRFSITIDDLKFYNASLKYEAEPGAFTIFIGENSRDVKEATFYYR